jgi:hypothetical protein
MRLSFMICWTRLMMSQRWRAQNAKAWKEDAETAPSVLYINHEKWMEKKANIGVQLSERDEDPIYEQNNFDKKGL